MVKCAAKATHLISTLLWNCWCNSTTSGLIFHAVPQEDSLGGFGRSRPAERCGGFPSERSNFPQLSNCVVDNSGKFRLLDLAQIFHAVHFLRAVVRRVIALQRRVRDLSGAQKMNAWKIWSISKSIKFSTPFTWSPDAHKPIPAPGKCVLLSARRAH